jgi:hypothetical protein
MTAIAGLSESSDLLCHLILFQSNIVGEGDEMSSSKIKKTEDLLLLTQNSGARFHSRNVGESSSSSSLDRTATVARFAYMEHTTVVQTTTTVHINDQERTFQEEVQAERRNDVCSNEADDLVKFETVVTSMKKLFLGALQTDVKGANVDDLLAVPLMILHAPAHTAFVVEPETLYETMCFLCGRLYQHSSTHRANTKHLCCVCEAEAYILFSNGLALSSPSRKSNVNMTLHHVLVRQNEICLAPEWSKLMMDQSDAAGRGGFGIPGAIDKTCTCDFCTMLVVEKNLYTVPSVRTIQACLNGMQGTDVWEKVKSNPLILRMFRRTSGKTCQLLWNDDVVYNTDSEHFDVIWGIVQHCVPSLAQVSPYDDSIHCI